MTNTQPPKHQGKGNRRRNVTGVEALIVEVARKTHQQVWTRSSHVGNETNLAIAACQAWQNAVSAEFGDRFLAEHDLGTDDMGEKIDLVDQEGRVAYELKASPNNPHMEFYRDVFKVLVYNRRNPGNRLRKLIFITPEQGAVRLQKSFTKDVSEIAAEIGLEVEVAAI